MQNITRFRTLGGDYRYDPGRFLDLKLACVEMMYEKLPQYDPGKEAKFTTFVHHDMRNAMLEICRRDESWSFKKMNHYKGIRSAAYISNNFTDFLHFASPPTPEQPDFVYHKEPLLWNRYPQNPSVLCSIQSGCFPIKHPL